MIPTLSALPAGGAIETVLGTFRARFGTRGLECLLLPADNDRPPVLDRCGSPGEPDPRFELLAAELRAYAAGDLHTFETEVSLHGTDFQLRVWDEVRKVGYGELTTYGEISLRVGGSARAVGAANGANPVPILIPCHRVIGSDGSLTGYGGGLPLKRRLLELESGYLTLL